MHSGDTKPLHSTTIQNDCWLYGAHALHVAEETRIRPVNVVLHVLHPAPQSNYPC